MEVYPGKMDGALHIMYYAHDAVNRPFFGGIPPSTEKLLQSFLKSIRQLSFYVAVLHTVPRTIIIWHFVRRQHGLVICKGNFHILYLILRKKEEIWLSPMTEALTPTEKSKKQRVNTKNATKNFDYTTIADRLRTVSWGNDSHPAGVVKPVILRSP